MTSLKLIDVDFQREKNALAHRTIDYDYDYFTQPIARRGQGYTIIFNFNKPIEPGDSLTITAETGSSRITTAIMPVSSSGSTTTWSAVGGAPSNKSLPVTINSPVNAVIGRYKMSVAITSGGRTSSSNIGTMALLFNPWVKGDNVYMEGDAEKNEYVLSDSGLFWAGSFPYIREKPWNYGQFEYGIMNICFDLLNKSSIYAPANDVPFGSDPFWVVRAVCAMINSNDDDGGVIKGNWSDNYSGGTSPTEWNGSVPILRQWDREGTVKYGQCWVYAGVFCTVCRCLGIPCRVITNFESAHDINADLFIDEYYDERGKRLSSLSKDSIWNFHVWNEIWIAKGIKYDGWHACDATPQERSFGIFRLGPCPVKAVKEGDVDEIYDVPFVFAEVNADKRSWTMYDDESRSVLYTESGVIGQKICTKAVGSFTIEDVTYTYKYPEESDMERVTFNKARNRMQDLNGPTVRDSIPEKQSVKPEFLCSFNKVEAQVGEDVNMELIAKNQSADPKNLNITLTSTAIIYNSTLVKDIQTELQSVTLGPNEEKRIPYKISYIQYINKLTPDNMILCEAMCEDDKGAKLKADNVVTLKTPPLQFKLSEVAKLNHKTKVEITVTNPLQEDVHDCVLRVEGSGLLEDDYVVRVPLVRKNDKATITCEINPKRAGRRTLIASFSSKILNNLKGFVTVSVTPSLKETSFTKKI